MSTLLKMQKFHPLCSRCIGMYPLQNRWTVLRYLQCYENFSECCTHLILPETALFSPTPTFVKEPFFYHSTVGFCLSRNAAREARKSIFMIASPERGDSPRGGEMPAGQRGPLSTRGTAVRRWRGFFVKSFYDVFGISGNPSVSATHCQLPFQGSLPCQTS